MFNSFYFWNKARKGAATPAPAHVAKTIQILTLPENREGFVVFRWKQMASRPSKIISICDTLRRYLFQISTESFSESLMFIGRKTANGFRQFIHLPFRRFGYNVREERVGGDIQGICDGNEFIKLPDFPVSDFLLPELLWYAVQPLSDPFANPPLER